ncbi:MAG: glycosyltransferase [Bacteroidota bacterium]
MAEFNINNKRILLCPLNWGLGHATRCIPIVNKLLSDGHIVFIASSGAALTLLKKEFPDLNYFSITDYQIKYSRKLLILNLFIQIPKLLRSIKNEHVEIEKIVTQNNIDLIISDNRYGAWSRKIKSIFITHQLNIQTPIFSFFVKKTNELFLARFDKICVPDFEGDINLSGKLSHCKFKHPNIQFIGSLSRFKKNVVESTKTIDLLFIISGPEPHRSIFENLILVETEKHKNLITIIVRGIPDEPDLPEVNDNCKIFNHLATGELQKLILSAKKVISRSGYTSIMDYAELRVFPFVIPTPSQTEQEYLAKYLSDIGFAYSMKQADFSIDKILNLQATNSTINFNSSYNLSDLLL